MPAAENVDAALRTEPSPPLVTRRCENCGVPLQGEHCHACGQPTKGLVRHFSSVLGDFFDTVFNIDSRVLRTIGPLLTKPGFLSLEYFAGRRVRYVTPMRLFLFLSLLAFFVVQGSIDLSDQGGDAVTFDADNDSMNKAATPAQVEQIRTRALAKLTAARKKVIGVPGGTVGLDIAIAEVNAEADKQLGYLRAVDKAKAEGKPLPDPPFATKDDFNFQFNGKRWDPVSNPIAFSWLPARANKELNRRVTHARDVLKSKNNGKPVIDALFNVLPQTLIVLMPIFALMLKVAYFFKRRLFMEHLIVALHSHSFIALAVTLIMSFTFLQDWLLPDPGFWHGLLSWARGLTIAWIPVYILLMQKRVYGQGWLMTLVKFAVLGLCYITLLSFALAAAMLIGLLTL
jgi:hypothetical protein